jgi:hypothetical protein
MLNVSKGIRVRTMVVIDQRFGGASAGVLKIDCSVLATSASSQLIAMILRQLVKSKDNIFQSGSFNCDGVLGHSSWVSGCHDFDDSGRKSFVYIVSAKSRDEAH